MKNYFLNRNSGYLLMPIVVLMTIASARQAGAQAARFATPRPSFAEGVSAQLMENPRDDSGNPGDEQDGRTAAN